MRASLAMGLVIWLAVIGATAHAAARSPLVIAPLRHDQSIELDSADTSASKDRHDCSPNWNAPMAIKRLLFQMGATVEEWPATVPAEQCLAPQGCAELLRAKAFHGYVLGGQIAARRHQPSTVQMWLIDVSQGRIMLSSQRCFGCDEPASLARQAAALAQRVQEHQAPWLPLSLLVPCASPSSASSSTEPPPPSLSAAQPAPQDRSVLLAIYGERVAERDRLAVNRMVHKTLGLLGQSAQTLTLAVHPDAPRSALRPAQQDHRLLDIELVYGMSRSGLTEARLRLSDAQHIRQSTIYCTGSDSCTPASLARQVQLHVAALLDAIDELDMAVAPDAALVQTSGEASQAPLCLQVLQCNVIVPAEKPRSSACADCGVTPPHAAVAILLAQAGDGLPPAKSIPSLQSDAAAKRQCASGYFTFGRGVGIGATSALLTTGLVTSIMLSAYHDTVYDAEHPDVRRNYAAHQGLSYGLTALTGAGLGFAIGLRRPRQFGDQGAAVNESACEKARASRWTFKRGVFVGALSSLALTAAVSSISLKALDGTVYSRDSGVEELRHYTNHAYATGGAAAVMAAGLVLALAIP